MVFRKSTALTVTVSFALGVAACSNSGDDQDARLATEIETGPIPTTIEASPPPTTPTIQAGQPLPTAGPEIDAQIVATTAVVNRYWEVLRQLGDTDYNPGSQGSGAVAPDGQLVVVADRHGVVHPTTYSYSCYHTEHPELGFFGDEFVYDAPSPDLAIIAEQALAAKQLPSSQVLTSPDRENNQIVALKTWLWVDPGTTSTNRHPQPRSAT
jgi:hypothetical protein